ncbi:MAG TPA: gas vesicle protein [Longimicrobiales bacterium]|nr:gas vesicle protein [Longimicrobiales bacterium]
MAERYELGSHRGQGLVDVLDRILDKGLVVAGDIKVNLANVELLTIQIRLLVCSIDKAEQIGMNWWRTDPHFAKQAIEPNQVQALSEKLDEISQRLESLERKKIK